MSSTSEISAAPPVAHSPPWYRAVTVYQWKALLVAGQAWMLDAFDFVLMLMSLTALQGEFGFGDKQAGLLATGTLLVSSVGGFIFGLLADRLGRGRALTAAILVFAVGTLGMATAQNFLQLVLWRMLSRLGLGGVWASGAVLVSETWPTRHRDKGISIMQSSFAVGYILASLAAAMMLPGLGWRCLFVVSVIPVLFLLPLLRGLREPVVWSAEPKKMVRRDSPMRTVFGLRLGVTIRATLLTASIMFAYWGLFTWLPAFLTQPAEKGGAGMSLSKSVGLIIPTQIGAFFGYLSFGFVAVRLGRRLAVGLYLVAAALVVPVYVQWANDLALLMLLGPVLGFVGHGYFSMFGSLLAELYPAHARATGLALVYNVSRAFAAAAPYAIGLLAGAWGIGGALTVSAAFFLLGFVLLQFLPTTQGKPLGTQ
jgi:MFS family permease